MQHRWSVLLLMSGCSLSTLDWEPCSVNAECRSVFGFGSVCSEGLCEAAALHPRCETTEPTGLELPLDPEQTRVIGTVFDHSLDTHTGRYRSAELAVSQANANGGLDGTEFAVIHCTNQESDAYDALTKDEASVEVATWLADQVGVPAIVGPAASSRTEAVYNAVAPTFGTLVVSPSATSPSLTPLDGLTSTEADPGLLWRTAPPDSFQGIAIAADLVSRGSRNVSVVYQTGAYGEGLESTFTEAFLQSAQNTSVGFPFDSATGPGDALADAHVGMDEVVFISSDASDVVAFLLGANAVGAYEALPLFLTDSARNVDVLNDAASASALFPQIRGSAPANPTGAVFDSFAASYAAENAGEDVTTLSFTAQSFDAAWLVIYGHAWAANQGTSFEGIDIARGFRHVSSGPPVDIRPTAWNEVRARFANGEDVDVTGASGSLDYQSDGETSAIIEIWTIDPSGEGFIAVDAL